MQRRKKFGTVLAGGAVHHPPGSPQVQAAARPAAPGTAGGAQAPGPQAGSLESGRCGKAGVLPFQVTKVTRPPCSC